MTKGTEKVLVIESNTNRRKILTGALEGLGYEIIESTEKEPLEGQDLVAVLAGGDSRPQMLGRSPIVIFTEAENEEYVDVCGYKITAPEYLPKLYTLMESLSAEN